MDIFIEKKKAGSLLAVIIKKKLNLDMSNQ